MHRSTDSHSTGIAPVLAFRTSPRRASRRGRTLVALALAAMTTTTAACDTTDPVAVPPSVAAVSVAAEVARLEPGQTSLVRATLKDADGRTITGRPVQWSSTNDAIATVSSAGLVTAVAAGDAYIAATSEGKRGEVLVTVSQPAPAVASVTLDATTLVLARGESRQLVATPRDAAGEPIPGLPVAWATAAGGAPVVTVSATGLVTATRMGTATVTAVVGGESAQATVTVLGDSDFDLVFELWGNVGDGPMRPNLYRLDMRTPGALPAAVVAVGAASEAAPSPDGTRLAFVCDNGGPAICVADADGSDVRHLPGFGSMTMLGDQPTWSPDGARIAFRGWAPGGPPGIFNPADIWVMDADGGNKVRLTAAVRNTDAYGSPTWSPELAGGSRIAFVHETRAPDGTMRASIASMRADGQDRQAVTAPGEHADTEPTWSPDGQTIAFVRTGGAAGGDIWLASAAGGNERALMSAAVEPPGEQRSPSWSPDGARIAFASNHEIVGTYFAWQIYTVRADGTNVELHTTDRAEKGHPAWIRR